MSKQHLAPTLAALAIGAALGACATPAYVSPTEVTRFTGATPAELARGTISIEPAPGIEGNSLEYGIFRAELADELSALGYDVIDTGGRQTAVLGIEQFVSEADRRGPVSVGGGVGAGSYGSGVGLGVGIDLSGRAADRVDTEVAVFIRPDAGGGNLWEGRARFVATVDSEFSDPARAADKALAALFTDFPGRSGETIEVE